MTKRATTTAERLQAAAHKEFNEHGFGGTDTNKIARRAGFSPQTFYRWYESKLEVFIKTYEQWVSDEIEAVSPLFSKNASDAQVVKAIVAQHRSSLVFRRSLRMLSYENDAVRAARAKARLRQIAFLKASNPKHPVDDASLATILLQTERLADALAESEFDDLGLSGEAAEQALEKLIRVLRMN